MARTFTASLYGIGAKVTQGSPKNDRFVLGGKPGGSWAQRFIDGGKGSMDYLFVPFDSSLLGFKLGGSVHSNRYDHLTGISGHMVGSHDESIYLRGVEYVVTNDRSFRLAKDGVYETPWRPQELLKTTSSDPITQFGSRGGSWSVRQGPSGQVISLIGQNGESFLHPGQMSNKIYFDSNADLLPDDDGRVLREMGTVKSVFGSYYPNQYILTQNGTWAIDPQTNRGVAYWQNGSIAAWINFS